MNDVVEMAQSKRDWEDEIKELADALATAFPEDKA